MVVDRLAAGWGAVFKTDRQRKCELAAGPGVMEHGITKAGNIFNAVQDH